MPNPLAPSVLKKISPTYNNDFSVPLAIFALPESFRAPAGGPERKQHCSQHENIGGCSHTLVSLLDDLA
eukprot:14922341-Heterocapsa_arctica.AAC.1